MPLKGRAPKSSLRLRSCPSLLLERRPLAFKVNSKFFWAYAILLYTQTRSLGERAIFGRGSSVEKVHHELQNFNGLGLMLFPFLFETNNVPCYFLPFPFSFRWRPIDKNKNIE
jgi:hypothetical protein